MGRVRRGSEIIASFFLMFQVYYLDSHSAYKPERTIAVASTTGMAKIILLNDQEQGGGIHDRSAVGLFEIIIWIVTVSYGEKKKCPQRGQYRTNF